MEEITKEHSSKVKNYLLDLQKNIILMIMD